jgi:hypothetical protein
VPSSDRSRYGQYSRKSGRVTSATKCRSGYFVPQRRGIASGSKELAHRAKLKSCVRALACRLPCRVRRERLRLAMLFRLTPIAIFATLILLAGCANDTSSDKTPTCPDTLVDAGDYWGTGTQEYGGDTYPTCPAPLPECPKNSAVPVCLRQAPSSTLCVCCDATWYCTN